MTEHHDDKQKRADERTHKYLTLLRAFSIVLVLLLSMPATMLAHDEKTHERPAAGCTAGVPAPSLDYSSGTYILENICGEQYPIGSLGIYVDRWRIGHLQTPIAMPVENAERTDDGFIKDFSIRTSFYDSQKHWLQLTKADATRLWGEPHKWPSFYTFDAASIWNGERNIYHLDLKFDDKDILSEYRIRGIGIANPQFVGPGPPKMAPSSRFENCIMRDNLQAWVADTTRRLKRTRELEGLKLEHPVVCKFQMKGDGSFKFIKIVSSSGTAEEDERAIQLVESCKPRPLSWLTELPEMTVEIPVEPRNLHVVRFAECL